MIRAILLLLCCSAVATAASARPRADLMPLPLQPGASRIGDHPHPSTLPGGIRGSAAGADTAWFGSTVWAADSLRWEAVPGGLWTFDSGVGSHFDHGAPHVNPYKDPSLHASMEGWIGMDGSFDTSPWFRRLTGADFPGTPCVGTPAGLGGSASLWAGVRQAEAEELCYAEGRGYGNNWNIAVEKSFAYPGAGAVVLTFDYVLETEPGFDYATVSVDTSGSGDRVEVTSYTGTLAGTDSLTLVPGTTLPSTAGTIRVIFRVDSDGAYSDEDGLYSTICGALALDDIALGGAITDGPSTFETGWDGWALAPATPGPGGDWSDIVALADLPAPMAPCPCSMSDSVLVFSDLTVGGGGHGQFQDNLAASPWIDLLAAGLAGAPGKVIEHGGYFDLPLLNYVFVQVESQWYPDLCPQTGKLRTSPFSSTGFVFYFGYGPTCSNREDPRQQIDFSSVVAAGAEQVRIALGVISFCRFYANCTGITNSTPWFDDVRLGVYGSPDAPYLRARAIDLPFDSFPTSGTIGIGRPGRVDSNNITGASSPAPLTSLGDTLIVQGGSGGAEVRVQFSVRPGPGIDFAALNTWLLSHRAENTWQGLDWYSARMDTAQITSELVPRAGFWMTAYHEADPNFSGTDTDVDPGDLDPYGYATRLANDIFPDDLFTPGTRLNLFYKARYDGSGTPATGVWYTHPDTAGGGYLEMEVLPSSMAADTTWNCVLYVDHFDGRGAQPVIEEALGAVINGTSANFEGTPWDRWDVRAPTSGQASFGRPGGTAYGATLNQALAYKAIL